MSEYTKESIQSGCVLLIDKPYDWTSFDVVKKIRYNIRKQFSLKKIKIGHAGTLDPLATGLLLVCTGKATKNISQIQDQKKEYIATLKLGATTPSYDRESEENKTFETSHLTKDLINQTINEFIGWQKQTPPVFSAVKVNGKRAYEYARKGEEPEIKAKDILIEKLELINFDMPEIVLRITCSKGTYIRALARDIGKALQSGAYLTGLRRTAIGEHNVDNAWDINNLINSINES